jgi:hypothetical protein
MTVLNTFGHFLWQLPAHAQRVNHSGEITERDGGVSLHPVVVGILIRVKKYRLAGNILL